MSILTVIKNGLRDLIPSSLQVPIKFWVNRVRGQLEEELQLLPQIIGPGDRVIDIGGNRGVYAYSFWRLGTKIEVFEPNPVCAGVLRSWAAGKDNVQIHAVALSNSPGEAYLYVPVDGSGVEHDSSASLERRDFKNIRQFRVNVQTLDSFCLADISLIKIDVEGYEIAVLYGAEQTIKASFPVLLIEIEQRHNQIDILDIFNLLESWGYDGFFLKQARLYRLGDFIAERDQLTSNFGIPGAHYINNFLFISHSRILSGDYKTLFKTWGGI